MKKTNLILLSLLLAIVFLLISCANTPIKTGKTIDEAFPERIEKTVIGMSIDEFKTVWPEAKRTGITENGETYEFLYYRPSLDYFDHIYTYFYFTNNALVKYESKKGL